MPASSANLEETSQPACPAPALLDDSGLSPPVAVCAAPLDHNGLSQTVAVCRHGSGWQRGQKVEVRPATLTANRIAPQTAQGLPFLPYTAKLF